ncbi:MAG: metal ABC transporter permease [Opitutales bacterium]|nr:metal ABC transporter permease [Opitutales bacterium]
MTGGESEFSEIFVRVLLLRDYNTRLVVLSTALLGIAGGVVGSFLLLRKRALMGDAIAHATFPGVVAAFMLLVLLGGDGRFLPWLLLGALAGGALGCVAVVWIRTATRIKDDAAMGIVLSVFFGGGVALFGMAQRMPGTSAAGLKSFLYGNTAAMVWGDFLLLAVSAVVVLVIALFFFKELRLLCFDEAFARAQGWPVRFLDGILLALAAGITVVGLQAVGIILIIAMLIIPAASARQWTHRFGWMLILAAALGGASGWVGSTVSALLPKAPAGAVIVLTAAAIFLVSLLAGSDRGLARRGWRARKLAQRVERQHLLRAAFELLEEQNADPRTTLVRWSDLARRRSWTAHRLRRAATRAYNDALVNKPEADGFQLSDRGWREATRVTRNHRLWELYLIERADIAPSHVDRDADTIEHVLGPDLVRELERVMARQGGGGGAPLPPSPHPLS